MNVSNEQLKALTEATSTVLERMLKLSVRFEAPTEHKGLHQHDVSASIGLSGGVVGSMIVGFDRQTAMNLGAALVGIPLADSSPELADAIGELTNMIVGAAKSKFTGPRINISCPSVVMAPAHAISVPGSGSVVVVPCVTPVGRFSIQLFFSAENGASGSDAGRRAA